jgi:hypothetical protein
MDHVGVAAVDGDVLVVGHELTPRVDASALVDPARHDGSGDSCRRSGEVGEGGDELPQEHDEDRGRDAGQEWFGVAERLGDLGVNGGCGYQAPGSSGG